MILILVKRPNIVNTIHFSFQPAHNGNCMYAGVCPHTHRHCNAEAPKHKEMEGSMKFKNFHTFFM
jgi:hypothetical protein